MRDSLGRAITDSSCATETYPLRGEHAVDRGG